jgi:hypothetical protein
VIGGINLYNAEIGGNLNAAGLRVDRPVRDERAITIEIKRDEVVLDCTLTKFGGSCLFTIEPTDPVPL